jgi:hypothetical protein
MSIGPLGGLAASAAGSPLQQTQGAEVERTSQDVAAQQRRVQNDQKADAAAGVGEADGDDHDAQERDADGRRLWELPSGSESERGEPDDSLSQQGKDPTGQSGSLLDLSG